VPGDGENGGDRVERKDDIGEFDREKGEKEDGDPGAAVLADEKLVLTQADGVNA